MDLPQIANNIVSASRLQLLAEALSNLKERIGGEASDAASQAQDMNLVQSRTATQPKQVPTAWQSHPRHNQPVAFPMLPSNQNKGKTGCKNQKK